MVVLDASALLAFLFREPGGQRVATHIPNSCMSTVNLSEVLGRFSRAGHDTSLILQRLLASTIEFVPFTEADASDSASLVPHTRELGLSFGDRACLSLARLRGLKALTADSAWQQLSLGIDVELIR